MLKSYKGYKVKSLNKNHPCRCLWRGFLQITRTTFLRFTILQDSQSLFTDGRTFIFFHETKTARHIRGFYFWRYVIRPLDKSYGEISSITLSPGKMRMKCSRIFPEI